MSIWLYVIACPLSGSSNAQQLPERAIPECRARIRYMSIYCSFTIRFLGNIISKSQSSYDFPMTGISMRGTNGCPNGAVLPFRHAAHAFSPCGVFSFPMQRFVVPHGAFKVSPCGVWQPIASVVKHPEICSKPLPKTHFSLCFQRCGALSHSKNGQTPDTKTKHVPCLP